MGIEIERKFLVNPVLWNQVRHKNQKSIMQGYLMNEPGKTIRVRLSGEQGFITIKGKSKGIARPEFEYKIPADEARQLLESFADEIIHKTRYEVEYFGKLWEVDDFKGDNLGLIIAEIELESENEPFELPPWAGREVTHETAYYNASLAANPFKNWQNNM
jgi:adenylate cyclase